MSGAFGRVRIAAHIVCGAVAAGTVVAGCQGQTDPEVPPAAPAAPGVSAVQAVGAARVAPAPFGPPAAPPEPAGGPWITPQGRFILRAHARGVQVYRAEREQGGRLAWANVATAAELTDAEGH